MRKSTPKRPPDGPRRKGRAKGKTDAKKLDAAFPIVGVGASAGGLEAFQDLLRHLPADTGMGFVLVQHLDPKHESALTHLLARATTMPVREVTQNLRVEPNGIYVIPPNVQMAIVGGVLKLTPRGKVRGATRSIDFFFEALARDQRERAIGVVLSGTASDGTLGLEAIKAESGVTFAQDESAKYDSMPRSAIAAGCVDFVLAPEQIAAELARIAKHPFVLNALGETPPDMHSEAEREADQREGKDAPLASGGHGTPRTGSRQAKQEAAAAADKPAAGEDGFKKILSILRNRCGVDFSLYKSSTIQRRVARRLVLNKHETLADYAAFLNGNAAELDALYSDVLISVTSFFRNPEAFDALQRKVFPALLAEREREGPVRVWTLGCSTGQEAYSIAMSFAESSEDIARAPKLQVFATDLNEALLEKARHGLYAKSLAADLAPERLRRFFVEEEGGWRVNKLLRDQVVFARQNVVNDPPFSHMDLISCRNLLIYLEAGLQKKIFPAFHYALKPGGFLFLGASESIGQFTDLFAPADKKQKIFSRNAAPTPLFRLPLPRARETQPAPGQHTPPPSAREQGLPDAVRGEFNAQREADRISVSQFAPPGVLINAEGQVLQFRGATGAYLEPPTGKASFDVLKMARESLMLPLRAAINIAKRENKPVRREGVRVGTRALALQVIPLRNLKEQCYLVLFEEPGASHGFHPSHGTDGTHETHGTSRKRIAELERELAETRDYLQSIQEQNEAANEELQAASEEVQSANEELQSINEELETSKEELESTNEELTTINDEMLSRNTELSRLNADLNNLQASIHIAFLLLARDLTIRRFSPLAEKVFNLAATDAGRGFGSIRHNLDMPDLDRLLVEVIETMSLREREVQDKDGRWYRLRARPYLTLDNKIDGVVLVLSDIDALKRSEHEIKAARDYAESVLRTAPVPFLVLRADLRVNTASDAFYENFKVAPAATEGRLIYEIGNGQWNIPKLRELLEEIIPQKNVFNGFEVTHEFATIGTRTMLLNARRVESAAGVPERILLAIEDITARKASEEALRASEERFRSAALAVSSLIWTNNAQGMMEGEQPGWAQFTGQTPEEYQGYGWARAVHPDDAQPTIEAWNAAVAEKRLFEFKHRVRRHDGAWRSCSIRAVPVIGGDGEIREWVGVHTDITERRQAEEALRASAEFNRSIIESSCDCIKVLDLEGRLMLMSERGQHLLCIVDIASLIGSIWADVWVGPDRAAAEVAVAAAAAGGTGNFTGLFLVRGEPRWWDVVITPILNWLGQPEKLLAVSRDVTERVRSEQAIQAVAAELARSARAKDDFLAALSHELRTPLTPVLMTATALADDPALPSELREQLSMIRRNIELEARLIDDLLDLTRISRGKLTIAPVAADLHQLLHHTAEIVRSDGLGKRVRIVFKLDAARHHALADPTRLQQVFWNLIKNALKFTPTGGTITVSTHNDAEDWILVSVEDTGIGIGAEALPNIFKAFEQGDIAGQHRYGGLGLGLAIAQAIAEVHGGTIFAKSEGHGLGSTFTVALATVDAPAASARASAPQPAPPRTLRLLVVDDHEATRTVLMRLLTRSGYQVTTANGVREALTAFAAERFDAVISDLGLPDGSGLDLMREIQRQRPVPGIALSGYGMEEDLRQTKEAGFFAHLVKPVNLDQLKQLLDHLTVPLA